MASYLKRFCLIISALMILFSNTYCDMLNFVSKKILFFLDDTFGAFYLENPNPSSPDLRELLFKDNPPTSYLTLYVSGKPYRINDRGNLILLQPFQLEDNTIQCNLRIDKILFNILFILTNIEDATNNSIICLVNMKNDGGASTVAGVRFLFNTVYGEGVNKPVLYLSGGERIEYDRKFGNENMPQFIFSGVYDWENQAFGKGLYIYPCINDIKPAMIIIGNWKKLNENELSYVINPHAKFKYYIFSKPDAAVAVYYNNINLKSGEDSTFGTILSVSKISKFSFNLANFASGTNAEILSNNGNPPPEKGKSMPNKTMQVNSSLNDKVEILEKLNALIDRLDSYLSNSLKPYIYENSGLEKGLEKSAPESDYGNPFTKSETGIPESEISGNGVLGIETNLSNTGNEESQAKLKSDADRLQKQYNDRIAGLKAYYEDLIKKHGNEYKEFSESNKQYYEEQGRNEKRSKKLEEVNDTIAQIDKKIGIIEELLQLNLDFESMPRAKIEEIQNKINKIEDKLK